MTPSRALLVLSLAPLLAAARPSAAAAQAEAPAPLDAAVAAYEEGRFEDARARLDEAGAAPALSREDLVRLLVHRVLVAQALVDEATLERALVRLATLDPEALEGRASPPILRRMEAALERTGGEPISVDVEHRRLAEGLRVEARVRGDVGALVESVRLRWRARGEARWTDAGGDAALLPGRRASRVEVVAEAFGPGGAVLASAGREDRPLRLTRPRRPEPSTASTRPADAGASGDDTAWHVVLVALGVALVAGGVTAAALFATSDESEQPLTFEGPPLVRW